MHSVSFGEFKRGRFDGVAVVAIVALALTACSDHAYDPNAPAIDPNAPVVHITQPVRGTFAGDVATLVVRGTASDDTGVTSLEVNGVAAMVAGDGTWSATIPVAPGTQLIQAVARDIAGNLGKESRAVVIGPMAPIAMSVPRAITAAMSAETFDALGRGLTGYLTSGQLAAAIAPDNPVIDAGGGPDCLYVQGSLTSAGVGAATSISLVPTTSASGGAIALDVELDQVSIGMHLTYAVACLDGSRDITITASHIRVAGTLDASITAGTLDASITAGAFDVALVDQSVQVTGLNVDLGGIPGDIADLLDLDSALGPIIGLATEKLVVPSLNSSLARLNDVDTVDVLGTPVDIAITPARIQIDATGALIDLDTSLRAHGDASSPGYVYLASQPPVMSAARGFELAVAADAANQLLGSFWAAGGLDKTFALSTGSYGELGTLYDRVELTAKVPPFIDATGDATGSATGGALKLTIGDLMATFKNGDTITTQIAINASVAIKVVAGPDGPRLDVGDPVTYVDVLDDNVSGANALSNAQFEAVTSFALGRVLAVGSGAVGAVPLPAFGGVAVEHVGVAAQTGYLVVGGDLE